MSYSKNTFTTETQRPERKKIIRKLQAELGAELKGRILPFWSEKTLERECGGFYGQIMNDLKIVGDADKSCIINSCRKWRMVQ